MNKQMKTLSFLILAISMTYVGTAQVVKTGDLGTYEATKPLPVLEGKKNEIIIAKSFIDTDPSVVLGAIVDLQTKEVLALDSYLKADAKPIEEVKTEMLFKDLVENNAALKSSYLGFISGSLDSKKRAEVTLIKNKVTRAKMSDLKADELKKVSASLTPEQRGNFGIIISYTDYLLTASFFTLAEKKAEASGYGANIGGSWYNKAEGLSIERSVVATYAPLRLVSPLLGWPGNTKSIEEVIQPTLDPAALIKIDKLNLRQ